MVKGLPCQTKLDSSAIPANHSNFESAVSLGRPAVALFTRVAAFLVCLLSGVGGSRSDVVDSNRCFLHNDLRMGAFRRRAYGSGWEMLRSVYG